MTASILRRSPSSSPSPASTSLPALQTDLSSSSSSSTSSSCLLDLRRTPSAPSTRRIRFAPLPEPRRDTLDTHDPLCDDPQPDTKPPLQTCPVSSEPHDDLIPISPSISPGSTPSSTRSTPTIRSSSSMPPSKNTPKLLRPFAFFRRASLSPADKSASLPASLNPSSSSLAPSPTPPSSQPRLLRISTQDIFILSPKSLFRSRSGSTSNTSHTSHSSSSPPELLDPTKSLHRSTSTCSGPAVMQDNGKRDWGQGSSQSNDTASTAGSGPWKSRASSSVSTFGTGGGRHTTSPKAPSNSSSTRPSTAPGSLLAPPKKHVKMLNGRVYGAKRYAAQTLANPFANVRDDPEFVEWGYGGMGSVDASAGIANDMWKGLQRSERGGALLAGSSFDSPSASTGSAALAVSAGGSGGSSARSTPRRKMSDNVPECGMGNVIPGAGVDEDDGSGLGWLKKRRAEREAKARLEQEAKELDKSISEGRKSGDSMDASMYASTISTTTSPTASTSVASTNLTTPTTSPLASRSPSAADLKMSPSPCPESGDLGVVPPSVATGGQFFKSDTAPQPGSVSKDEHEHHVLTAVRLSPNISGPHKHNPSVMHGYTPSLSCSLSQAGKSTSNDSTEQVPPLSPVDTEEMTTSTNSFSEDEDEAEPSRDSNEDDPDDDDDDDDEAQDVERKTALGAGVEKISRHVGVEAR